ncbi:MAG: histidine phosphatase family protein [Actinomycetes bacterium]
MHLILVRHAKAAPGEPDALRPLTHEGHEAALALGDRFAALAPDAVVSSPLLRARQTAEPIAAAAGVTAETDVRLAPGASADDLRAVIDGRGDTVIAVGHQPDCSEIVLALTGRKVGFSVGSFQEIEL